MEKLKTQGKNSKLKEKLNVWEDLSSPTLPSDVKKKAWIRSYRRKLLLQFMRNGSASNYLNVQFFALRSMVCCVRQCFDTNSEKKQYF